MKAKPIAAALLVAGALLTGCGTVAPQSEAVVPQKPESPKEKTPQQISAEAIAATVQIVLPAQSGSGFFIDDRGDIVTADFIVETASPHSAGPTAKKDSRNPKKKPLAKITVTIADGTTHEAKILYEDKVKNIAVLHVDVKDTKSLKFGDSDKLVPGDQVIACGNAFDRGIIVTRGIISAPKGPAEGLKGDAWRFDAASNPGNAGGPLLNANGEAVAMVIAIYSIAGQSAGLGYAIPANDILKTIPAPLRPQESGGAYASKNKALRTRTKFMRYEF